MLHAQVRTRRMRDAPRHFLCASAEAIGFCPHPFRLRTCCTYVAEALCASRPTWILRDSSSVGRPCTPRLRGPLPLTRGLQPPFRQPHRHASPAENIKSILRTLPCPPDGFSPLLEPPRWPCPWDFNRLCDGRSGSLQKLSPPPFRLSVLLGASGAIDVPLPHAFPVHGHLPARARLGAFCGAGGDPPSPLLHPNYPYTFTSTRAGVPQLNALFGRTSAAKPQNVVPFAQLIE